MSREKVIIVGGGFAGIQFVQKLDTKLYDVLIIDKVNHHQFQPLYYQVATSQLEPSSISFPLRHIFKNKKNISIRHTKVLSVKPEKNTISTTIGDFEYDHLVLAIGCKTNFFGNTELGKHVLTLKTTYEAILIRNHVLETFENIISANEHEKETLLNMVIVGAGPTGLELAGAFSEIRKNVLPKDYPKLDFSKFRIILVEGGKNVLNNMSETARKAAAKYLKKMDIDVRTESIVKDYDGETLLLTNGETIPTKTVIWAAGVIANSMAGLPKESVTYGNRLKVDRFSKVDLCDNIYALGDLAYMETPKYPKGHPQLANVAINQAKNLAHNLNKKHTNKEPKPYEYLNLGSMATLGRNKAVVDLPFMKFTGFFAWLTWMFLHLMLILNVKNKIIIFINWSLTYFTKDTALRLIFKKPIESPTETEN